MTIIIISSYYNNNNYYVYRQTDSSTPSASAVLTCEEDITAFDCVVEDGTAKVATVCETGLFLYQFSLSPLPSKPVTCCSVVQYVTSPPKVTYTTVFIM